MFFLDVVFILIVDVDVGSFHICKAFELTLQGLTDIMSDLERQVLIHDNINLDVILLSGVVGTAL